ncbi:RNHCP domain-containing protein [Flexilinea flocculi]|jgi:rubrerythrin|uniref:Protein containing RNHCP domain n=1 Tax=Flexilinea flocculi TaxID=1678840 RepID=A0A0S7BJ40_9CHLR|nr:RNHCP domain-containing protein [Flexilinea flocculi]NMB93774.1 RNHCP domain-containing protein [Flexilinea flocculi]GAP40373.1 protein containing RNHCP domain [Flexilinea flocculi]
MSAVFIRKKEDFICENCGKSVKGNGYTNHCPFCLYSKHVDIHPGDRSADCGGLMKPIRIEIHKGEKIIYHQCLKCGYVKANKSAPDDDFDRIIEIMSTGR